MFYIFKQIIFEKVPSAVVIQDGAHAEHSGQVILSAFPLASLRAI